MSTPKPRKSKSPPAEPAAQPPTISVAATFEPTGSLVAWTKNPRKNAHAVGPVAESIKRFGFGAPIIARRADRVVIAGHTRLLAAKQLGLAEVPVRFVDLDEAQSAALALADNKLGELADWDDAALAGVLHDLEGLSCDLDGLGWTGDELATLTGADGAPPPATDPFQSLPTVAPAFRNMVFTLSEEQHEQVEAAIKQAVALGPFVDSGNENRNGNALARICETFRGAVGANG